MSMMICHLCGLPVDTDDDPDSLYVPKYEDKAICSGCRSSENLPSEFEEPTTRIEP